MVSPPQEQPEEETLPPGYYQERELVKLLLLYGSELLVEQREDENGEKFEEQVSVAQMIIDDLLNDEITFIDPVNRIIFDAYDQGLNNNELPNDQFFITHENEQVSQLAIELMTSPYKLDRWKEFGIIVKREEDTLLTTVQSAILRYKDMIIDSRRKEIEKEIKEEQDPDNQLILMKKKKHWDELRVQINKLLGIVIAK